ncbi:MAG: TetR/AcrR family transcriptional regulator [Desulfocapsaceae bacterium]|nr:TetR/AcrR family transcriptional regulator [Desulfocapsaceae bacterium]
MNKGAETKKRIIEQTAGLFNSKGYYATTLSEVMQATGLKKGGIYNHFSSKEELALAAFQHNVTLIGRRFYKTLQMHETCKEKLMALISAGLDVYKGDPVSGGCPIMNAGIESDNYYPPLQEAAAQALGELKRMIKKELREGIDNGDLSPDIDADELTDFFISAYEGGMFVSRMENSDKSMQAVMKMLSSVVEELSIG